MSKDKYNTLVRAKTRGKKNNSIIDQVGLVNCQPGYQEKEENLVPVVSVYPELYQTEKAIYLEHIIHSLYTECSAFFPPVVSCVVCPLLP